MKEGLNNKFTLISVEIERGVLLEVAIECFNSKLSTEMDSLC
jgi:hypothetical protein